MNLEDYIELHTTPEDNVQIDLRRKTNLNTTMTRKLSGRQGKLLEFLSVMIAPKYILEIGTFKGYSAYCLAKGLQAGGKLNTFEVHDEYKDNILDFFERGLGAEDVPRERQARISRDVREDGGIYPTELHALNEVKFETYIKLVQIEDVCWETWPSTTSSSH